MSFIKRNKKKVLSVNTTFFLYVYIIFISIERRTFNLQSSVSLLSLLHEDFLKGINECFKLNETIR